MRLSHPAPGRPITSPYGPRRHPITGELGKMHHGVDFGGSFNVLSAGDGIVTHIGWSPRGGGHTVVIKHASNLYTVYYHGAHRTPLKKGDRVLAQDFVYRSGTTGASTGNHLHFEARKSRLWGHTQDPLPLIDGTVPAPVSPTLLQVNGRLDRNTWKAWQDALKEDWGYEGIIDGRTGPRTWRAIQRSGVEYGYPANAIDGIPGPNTRKAVQRRLKAKGFYAGRIDGIWGKGTISGLQRALNGGKY
jgi:murein DD-endopeptidase MepM/ murein hydrolase activator NlpD